MESSSSAMVWMLNPSTMGPAYSSSAVVVVMLLGDGVLIGSSPSLAMAVLSGSLAGGSGLAFSSSSPSVSVGRDDMSDFSLLFMITSFTPGSGMM